MDLLNCLRANCQFDTVNAKKFLLKLASNQETKKANRKEAKKIYGCFTIFWFCEKSLKTIW